jgi:beta-lactamase class A
MEQRRRRLFAVMGALVAIVAVVGAIVALQASTRPSPGHSAQPVIAAPSSPVITGAATPAAPAPAPAPTKRATTSAPSAATRIARLIAAQPAGSVSVAVLNTATGKQYSAGAAAGMWTASAYKLLVLEALLLDRQEAGTTLSDQEMSLATAMMQASDNEAGYDLFLDNGANFGLTAAARRFGMANTVPGRSDPTFTTTSARDCLVLLQNIVRNGPLNAASRSVGVDLMSGVQADQRWGVGVIADRGTTVANKNGWLSVENTNGPGETDDGRWIVNSLGIVTVHGQRLLMSIMTQHQPSFQDGVDLVQTLARALPEALPRP